MFDADGTKSPGRNDGRRTDDGFPAGGRHRASDDSTDKVWSATPHVTPWWPTSPLSTPPLPAPSLPTPPSSGFTPGFAAPPGAPERAPLAGPPHHVTQRPAHSALTGDTRESSAVGAHPPRSRWWPKLAIGAVTALAAAAVPVWLRMEPARYPTPITLASPTSAADGSDISVAANGPRGVTPSRRMRPSTTPTPKGAPVTSPSPLGFMVEREAEDLPVNILAGTRIATEHSASGRAVVTDLGRSNNLTMPGIYAPVSGAYRMRIWYQARTAQSLQIDVNAKTVAAFSVPKLECCGTSIEVVIPLNAGENTITFGSREVLGPDIDRITIVMG